MGQWNRLLHLRQHTQIIVSCNEKGICGSLEESFKWSGGTRTPLPEHRDAYPPPTQLQTCSLAAHTACIAVHVRSVTEGNDSFSSAVLELVLWSSCSPLLKPSRTWRMTRLTPPAVLLLLFVFLSSAEDNATDIVEVFYSRETISAASGSSVKLSCEAHYDFKRCNELHVAWNKQKTELTDPKKYLTTVNETVMKDTMRRRQIVTEILNLQQDDGGGYQCSAECDRIAEAVGHFIYIKVQATDIVEVFYSRETITAASGSSVKLTCEARYDFNRCDGLRVAWNKQNTELTDPKKYLTTVTNTVTTDNMRRRQIVTEILNLQQDDVGGYQCSAECNTGGDAVGHFIYINVRD